MGVTRSYIGMVWHLAAIAATVIFRIPENKEEETRPAEKPCLPSAKCQHALRPFEVLLNGQKLVRIEHRDLPTNVPLIIRGT